MPSGRAYELRRRRSRCAGHRPVVVLLCGPDSEVVPVGVAVGLAGQALEFCPRACRTRQLSAPPTIFTGRAVRAVEVIVPVRPSLESPEPARRTGGLPTLPLVSPSQAVQAGGLSHERLERANGALRARRLVRELAEPAAGAVEAHRRAPAGPTVLAGPARRPHGAIQRRQKHDAHGPTVLLAGPDPTRRPGYSPVQIQAPVYVLSCEVDAGWV